MSFVLRRCLLSGMQLTCVSKAHLQWENKEFLYNIVLFQPSQVACTTDLLVIGHLCPPHSFQCTQICSQYVHDMTCLLINHILLFSQGAYPGCQHPILHCPVRLPETHRLLPQVAVRWWPPRLVFYHESFMQVGWYFSKEAML
jgi:hypothetical protein